MPVTLAIATIHNILDHKPVDMNWADLSTASNVVAQLENAEADKKIGRAHV